MHGLLIVPLLPGLDCLCTQHFGSHCIADSPQNQVWKYLNPWLLLSKLAATQSEPSKTTLEPGLSAIVYWTTLIWMYLMKAWRNLHIHFIRMVLCVSIYRYLLRRWITQCIILSHKLSRVVTINYNIAPAHSFWWTRGRWVVNGQFETCLPPLTFWPAGQLHWRKLSGNPLM